MLIHPARGIAVLDILPSRTPGAAQAVRARLHAARFPAVFAGHLPVVHLEALPRQMPFLPALLDDALAAQPPLTLPGGGAWADAAERALAAEEPAVPRPASQRFRHGARVRRRRRAAALRAVGAVLLCSAALGGVLAMVLGGAPAPAPVASAVAPGAAVEKAGRPPEAAVPAPAPAPEPVPAAPPVPARGGTGAVAPSAGGAPPPPPPAVEAPPPTSSPRLEASAPASARKVPERAAPRRRQEVGAAPPLAGAGAAPPPQPPPEAAVQRCRRVAALVGSGARLDEADMRFFNEACIRW